MHLAFIITHSILDDIELHWITRVRIANCIQWLINYMNQICVAFDEHDAHNMWEFTIPKAYKDSIPDHLIINATNIQLMNPIGQGIIINM